MARKNGDRSFPEKEVEENLMIYCKPVTLYNILQTRSQDNPYLLQKCLSYKIQAKRKKKSTSGGAIIFNYMDCNNKMLKAEVVGDFSCPFCLNQCGSSEGVKLHLTSSHDVFEYNFRLSEKAHLEVDVSVKLDAFRFGELIDDLKKHHKIPFSFCSKRRKRSQRDYDSNNMKELNVVDSMELDLGDLPRETENVLSQVNDGNGNVLSQVNDGNVSSPAKANSLEKTSDILTITQPEIAQSSESKANSLEKTSDILTITQPAIIAESSEPKVPPVSRRKQLFAERSKAKRIDLLKKRQFYHSKTYKAMSFEEVMSDADSENEADNDLADLEERLRLNQLVGVSDEEKRFMFLWNSLVRKQRVIADGHVPWACEAFTKLHEKELNSSKTFFWQWRLFMIKLLNHGLVCAKTIDKCNTILNDSKAAASSSSS